MDPDAFESLCTKFLFTNYNPDPSQLNTLLNQLNDACHNHTMIINPQVSNTVQ